MRAPTANYELLLPGLGSRLLKEMGSIKDQKEYKPHYDQLLQKLAELLVLRRLLQLPWPKGTKFEHEPAAIPKGKRPELRVVTPNRKFLFEVKAPALREHQASRNQNPLQAPGRGLPLGQLGGLGDAAGGGVTLPRDNPVKDFLVDADKKFGQFKEIEDHTSILVIVWDDFIYEPITVLTSPVSGLLTPQSYFKDAHGAPVQFPSIDAVVVIRHLTYFSDAAAERPLPDRANGLDFGGEHDLPNVRIPVSQAADIPAFIFDGLRALPLDHPRCVAAAEYHPQDLVFWV